MTPERHVLLGFLLLLLAALACSPPFGESNEPPPTPTPLGDTLVFNIPTYGRNLQPGDTIPGTRLTYVGREADGYRVSIDGLAATKRIGDSFLWSGTVAPGVFANYNLRLTTETFGRLPVVGQVELLVLNPQPAAVTAVPTEQARLHYDLITVNYYMQPGGAVPGSTLVYQGIITQAGEELAQMSGLTGYPLLALGDSLNWTGRLLDNVYISYSLRVLSIDEHGLRLGGTAQMWIIQ